MKIWEKLRAIQEKFEKKLREIPKSALKKIIVIISKHLMLDTVTINESDEITGEKKKKKIETIMFTKIFQKISFNGTKIMYAKT